MLYYVDVCICVYVCDKLKIILRIMVSFDNQSDGSQYACVRLFSCRLLKKKNKFFFSYKFIVPLGGVIKNTMSQNFWHKSAGKTYVFTYVFFVVFFFCIASGVLSYTDADRVFAISPHTFRGRIDVYVRLFVYIRAAKLIYLKIINTNPEKNYPYT